MSIFRQFTFKQRDFFQKLSGPATEEERIGERNQRILNKFLITVLLILLGLGVWKSIEMIIGWFH